MAPQTISEKRAIIQALAVLEMLIEGAPNSTLDIEDLRKSHKGFRSMLWKISEVF